MIRRSQIQERLYHLRLNLESVDMLLGSLVGHCTALAEEVLEHGTTRAGYEQLVNLLHRVGATESCIRELQGRVDECNGRAFIPKEEDQ